jgi:membrane dipeptidase
MYRITFASVGLFLLVLSACERPLDYMEVHKSAFVVDFHSDSIDRLFEDGSDFGVLSSSGHMDIPRLLEAGVDLQFFAIYVSPDMVSEDENDPDSSAIRAHVMIDRLEEILEKYPDRVGLAKTAAEAREIASSGRVAVAIGLEGGHIIENSIEKLRVFHARGARYMGLTWNNTNDWADAAKVETEEGTRHGGLTDFGVEVVKEMNRLGMIVDVSHVSESTFWDVIEVADKPVIASHSCVYSIDPHYRNLKDEQIEAIAENGGLIGINFYPAYLDSTFNRLENEAYDVHDAELDSLKELYRDQPVEYYARRNKIIGEAMGGYTIPYTLIVDHIDYIVNLVGADHVGLGSDFDGVPVLPAGMEDVTKLPEITMLLIERGYDEVQIRKILGGNFMRVFEAVTGS